MDQGALKRCFTTISLGLLLLTQGQKHIHAADPVEINEALPDNASLKLDAVPVNLSTPLIFQNLAGNYLLSSIRTVSAPRFSMHDLAKTMIKPARLNTIFPTSQNSAASKNISAKPLHFAAPLRAHSLIAGLAAAVKLGGGILNRSSLEQAHATAALQIEEAVSLSPLPQVSQPLAQTGKRSLLPMLSRQRAASYMEDIARRERRFYQPGVAYDARTGMTYDGRNTDFQTGNLRGRPRAMSAPSKESLHLILLIKALQGQRTAQLALSPDPNDLDKAAEAALTVLKAKIGSYEKFNREYPGYGGFLPWYRTRGKRIVPERQWQRRAPALDNGQLAWSIYLAANILRDRGYEVLARRYQDYFDLMRRNVVGIFFDPEAKKLRGEAQLKKNNRIPPQQNSYASNGYFLSDPYEGLMMMHFADLFGNWTGRDKDKEALWNEPLRRLVTYDTNGGRITVEKAWMGSSNEQWGYLVLPFLDEPLAKILFSTAQAVRTIQAVERGWPGLRAATHRPVRGNAATLSYVSNLGTDGIGGAKSSRLKIFAPYAAFPIALVNKELFATWLMRMLDMPGMWGPYGIGESYDFSGDKRAPLLTWDGKALPLIAWMGGISSDIRRLLLRDGLYEKFRARVAADYKRLDDVPIEGADTPPSTPLTKY
ncbi:MAG: hypothetical protein ACYCPQ_11160 [Elusimicrobiota bacterium]